jgi:RecB family endonuclease NucS
LVEALVAPGALKLFQERGAPVTGTVQRAKQRKDGEEMEIDILAKNSEAVVAVEVKTTLKVADVDDFLAELPRFHEFFDEYRGLKLYGAVAGVNIEEKADRYAYKNGLFVLTLSGAGTVVILNNEKFVPKDFSQAGA